MKYLQKLVALVLSAAPLALLTPPAFGQVPNINAQAVCNARDASAKVMHSVPLQSIAECVQGRERRQTAVGSRLGIDLRPDTGIDARAMGVRSARRAISISSPASRSPRMRNRVRSRRPESNNSSVQLHPPHPPPPPPPHPATTITTAAHGLRSGMDRRVGGAREDDRARERHGKQKLVLERRPRRPRLRGLIIR